jgi:hypothetical protein
LPCVELELADVVVVVVEVGGVTAEGEQGPIVSPCFRCAGTAGAPTVIVTIGFVVECVW